MQEVQCSLFLTLCLGFMGIIVLFDLILYVPVNSFSVMSGCVLLKDTKQWLW